MADVASRQLRNETRALLARATAGETITITVDGRPAAMLTPVGRRPRWVSRREFVSDVLATRADPGLAAELADLAGELTDDLAGP